MNIIRAKHMGFCFGVLEAINTCNSLARQNHINKSEKKIYILGMLVHNKFVVSQMEEKGFEIITEEDLLNDRNPLKKNDIVVIRAHGTSKEIYQKLKEKSVIIHDATCIFVSKIREKIEKASNENYDILFVGDKNHPEVKGIISFAKNLQIFEDLETAKKIYIDPNKKYLLATQTTLNKNKFNEIKNFFLNTYKNVKIFDKICGATSVRQEAVKNLAENTEIVFIVGDKKSSNTKKLYEISKNINEESYLIENENDLNISLLKNKTNIGITAGASTPELIIKKIENKIRGTHKMPNLNERDDEFLAMLDDYQPNQEKRVEGVIDSIDLNYTYLDVPGERTAVRVRTEELKDYEVGDTVEVLITGLQEFDDDQEYISASRRKIEIEENWSKIEDSFKNKTVLEGVITKKIKGGYLVQALLYPGFLPSSLSEIKPNDENVLGRKVSVIVKDIKLDQKDKRNKKITYSVKDIKLLAQEKEFANLEEGQVLKCKISEVLDFGLATEIGSLRGFIHISEISWKRVEKLDELYKVGDEVEAKILSLDKEKKNVKLSIKQLIENPWDNVEDKYKVGDEVEGIVTKVLPYGAFIELESGVEGLVHISDFSWTKKKLNINDFVKVGEKVKVKITELQKEGKKLKLGIKQLVENPWNKAEEKFAVGNILKGKVVETKDFGIFVQVDDGVDAFVHVSDFNWMDEATPKFKSGDEVELKVIDLDIENKKIKGSIKALKKSPWDKALEEFKEGITVERKVKTVTDFGIFVELLKGVDGFIPTQFASKDFIKDIRDKFKEGDLVKAMIVEVNKTTQKIKLSIKKIEQEEERREERELIEKYSTSSSED